MGTQAELLDAELALTNAETALVMALHDYAIALAALDKSEPELEAIRTQVLDALEDLLDDGDEDVRWAAVVSIGEMKDPEAAPVLVAVVRDRNPMVANAAERALQKMGIAQRRFGTRDEG